MSQFEIYTYQFAPLVSDPAKNPVLFDDQPTAEQIMASKQSVFQSLFAKDAGLEFNIGGEVFHHQILLNYNGIIAMRLANNRQLVQEENFQVRKLVNQPSCLIVIDNRGGCQSIAIQKNPTAFSQTKRVASILQATFNAYLLQHFLSVDIRRRLEENSFWQIVDRCPEGVKSVRFEFSYPNLPRVSDNIHKMFTELAKEFGANSKYEINAIQGQRLILDRDNEMLKGLIKASCDSGHGISVLPNGSGQRWHSTCTGTGTGVTTELDPEWFESDQRLFDDRYEKLAQEMNQFK